MAPRYVYTSTIVLPTCQCGNVYIVWLSVPSHLVPNLTCSSIEKDIFLVFYSFTRNLVYKSVSNVVLFDIPQVLCAVDMSFFFNDMNSSILKIRLALIWSGFQLSFIYLFWLTDLNRHTRGKVSSWIDRYIWYETARSYFVIRNCVILFFLELWRVFTFHFN